MTARRLDSGRSTTSSPQRELVPAADLRLWAGRLVMWPGRALYVGLVADTAPHAHHALQIPVALDRPFALRAEAPARWQEYDLALIEPDRIHQLDGGGAPLAILYLDPESHAATTALVRSPRDESFSMNRSTEWKALVPSLRACTAARTVEETAVVAADLLDALALMKSGGGDALDRRVGTVIELLRGSLDERVSAADAARAVGLSSHRFQHLFRDSTGIPYRRYKLWLRLVAAVEAVASGASLTNAAHSAGFSDSAHLSRTFRKNFGISPSSLVKNSEFVQADRSSRP